MSPFEVACGGRGTDETCSVYLVREVLYDPDPNDDDAFSSFPYDDDHSFNSHSYDDYSPADTPTAASPPSRPPMRSWASDPFMPHQPPVYGRNFALKCLCKKDLTDELVEVQRGEAVLHRALPEHEFIVRLYDVSSRCVCIGTELELTCVRVQAYETDDWLFLVLEYCPGADLFYWLEGGNDDSAAISSRATSPFQHHPSSGAMDMQPHSTQPSSAFNTPHHSSALAMDMEDSTLSRTITSNTDSDRTPPSPSLLSSTADASLLSRKRLRLISRMFCQMCAAVQACHEVGIAHRDIKPENFIVMDGRAEGESRGQGRVVVKITDWGLGTREQMCEDFDCGSKPYMAYGAFLPLMPPSSFGELTRIVECRNNLQPTYDPRQADIWSLGLVLLNLLYHRNPWADPSLDDPDFADYVRDPRGFLQDRFEGIGEEVSSFLADRVFCDVLEMEGDSLRRRVTAGEFGRWAGRLVMMMGEGKRKRASVSEHTFHLFATSSRPGQHHGVKTVAHSPASNAPGLLSQYAPAATTSPVPIEERLLSDGSELATVQEVEEKRVFAPSSLSPPTSPRRASRSPLTFVTEDDDELPSPSFPPHASALRAASPASPPTSPRPRLDRIRQDSYASSSSQSRDTDDREPEAHEDDREGGDLRCWGEPETVNPKSKRRKRGARKGKSIRTPGETSPPTPSPLSPASPYTVPTVIEQRDQVLSDLAAASQNLARELSKTTRTFGTQSTSALSFSTSTEEKVATAKKAAKSGGVFGRMKNLVKDGNSDLVAFKQRVEERNASIGAKADTYSAPAKLQGRHAMSGGSVEVGSVGSRGSVGSASWGGGSAAGDEDVLRGRTKGDMSPGHWTSASSRRERLDKQRQRPFDLSPSSSTRNGTLSSSTFDSRNHTPLSSFSSVASGDLIAPHHNSSSISTVRDWRQPSPHPRPYSTSRPPHLDEHSSSILAPPKLSPPLPILHLAPLQVRPKLKDAAVDTRDLNPLVASSPLPPVLAPSPVKMVRHPSAPGKDKETSSKNKLAKMLNSISVFNRSQERQVPAT